MWNISYRPIISIHQATGAYQNMKHKCQDKKQPPGTNHQGHQTHVQDKLPVRTHDEAPLSIAPQHNSLARTLNLAPLAIPARTFKNLSLCHKPSWLILLAQIQSTGQRLSHDHRSHDLHSPCPNIASIMTGTKGISAYQATDLPALLSWLIILLFFFVWHHMHA